ncbi:MAG: glycosyltransferase family 2 protein [Paramuribaculum sp.]|nr:glycosyltransferase family 2 protein [Paramuribaculum sp.]
MTAASSTLPQRPAASADARILISVIVPYHNAERTIQRTLESLSAQSIGEAVEYLLVNDGSTDRSEEIVELYLRLDRKMAERTVLTAHQFRRGSASAYRTGVEKARGEYLIKCDADDMMHPDALSTLLQAAAGADIVAAPHYELRAKGRRRIRRSKIARGLNRMRIDTAGFSLCNKLIRRSLVTDNDLLPTEGIDFWEDLSVSCRAIALARSISTTDTPVYYYCHDTKQPSMTISGRTETIVRDRMVYALLMEKWFVDHKLSGRYGRFLDSLKLAAKIKLLQPPHPEPTRWKDTFTEVNGKIWRSGGIRLSAKLYCWLAYKLPASLFRKITGWIYGIIADRDNA